jgi:hypothetical protein
MASGWRPYDLGNSPTAFFSCSSKPRPAINAMGRTVKSSMESDPYDQNPVTLRMIKPQPANSAKSR